MEWWQAVVLGVVEGITEYLPISSTGHLVITSALLGLDDPARKQAVDDFNIVIQGGAILAVVSLYFPRFLQMLRGVLGREAAGLRLLVNLVIAFVPAAVLGLVVEDWIDRHLFAIGPVAAALALGGVFMIVLDRRLRRRRVGAPVSTRDVTDVTPRQALVIGLLQCVSLWPGVSRAMMTITGGFIAGLPAPAAAEFSFLLGVMTLGAASLWKLRKAISPEEGQAGMFEQIGVAPALVGIAVAAVSAAVAVRWLVGFLNRHGLAPFGWYRIGLAGVLAALAAGGQVSF